MDRKLNIRLPSLAWYPNQPEVRDLPSLLGTCRFPILSCGPELQNIPSRIPFFKDPYCISQLLYDVKKTHLAQERRKAFAVLQVLILTQLLPASPEQECLFSAEIQEEIRFLLIVTIFSFAFKLFLCLSMPHPFLFMVRLGAGVGVLFPLCCDINLLQTGGEQRSVPASYLKVF